MDMGHCESMGGGGAISYARRLRGISLFHIRNGFAFQVRWWPLKMFLSRFVID